MRIVLLVKFRVSFYSSQTLKYFTYISFTFIFLLISNFEVKSQSVSKVDSLKELLTVASDAEKPKLLNKICWKLRNSHPEEAVEYGARSIVASEKQQNFKQWANAYGYSGVAYRNIGNYPQAFDCYFKGLEISQKHSLKEQEGYALINIGNLYIYQESYNEAVNFLEKAVIISTDIDNVSMQGYCNLNLGRALLLKNKLDLALNYLQKANTSRRKQGNKEGEATCLKYIAEVYLRQSNVNECIKTCNYALSIAPSEDNDLLSDIYVKLAKSYIQKKDLKEAELFANKGLEQAEFIQSKLRIRNALQTLFDIYSLTNDYKKANKQLILVTAYNDSLFTVSLRKKIVNLQYEAETKAKQLEIKHLQEAAKKDETVITQLKQFRTILTLLVISLVILGLISLIFFLRSRKVNVKNKELLESNNSLLEQEKKILSENAVISAQKNKEIESKNMELNLQKEELQAIVDSLAEANNKITFQHKNITDSINYAKHIQKGLLPSNDIIESYLPGDHFLFFKPKEVVSGDFYYVNKIQKHLVFAVADCTGHGVPGGFISMLGITYIHEIIRRLETDTPGETLDLLRSRVKDSFSAFGTNSNDGLDIAFCSIDTETNILQYAGAYNPLWIIRQGELIEIKATRNPIGNYPRLKSFINNIFQLENNDKIYIFSDGYLDQFSQESMKKFSIKRFRKLILETSHLPMQNQSEVLSKTLIEWQGGMVQIDDITVMGIEWKI